jgi:hypothetical protein
MILKHEYCKKVPLVSLQSKSTNNVKSKVMFKQLIR